MENMDRVQALYWKEKYDEIQEYLIELADKLDFMELKEAKARVEIENLKKELKVKNRIIREVSLSVGFK